MIHSIALLVKALSLSQNRRRWSTRAKTYFKNRGKKKKTDKMNFFWIDKIMRVRV